MEDRRLFLSYRKVWRQQYTANLAVLFLTVLRDPGSFQLPALPSKMVLQATTAMLQVAGWRKKERKAKGYMLLFFEESFKKLSQYTSAYHWAELSYMATLLQGDYKMQSLSLVITGLLEESLTKEEGRMDNEG